MLKLYYKFNFATEPELFPNPKKQKSNYTANRSTNNHTRVLNFSDFIGNMDGNNTHNTSNNISTYSKHKGKVYKLFFSFKDSLSPQNI